MSSFSSAATGILVRHRPFLFYFVSRGPSKVCYQIGAVAVGWQVYALTESAFDLGKVGLVQFMPTALLTFAAGHVADRYNRKRIAQLSQFAAAAAAAFLAWGSFAGCLDVPEIFAAVAVFGVAIAFESPAAAAILPGVAPEGMLQKAAALSTGAFQVATIGGPALSGLIYTVAPGVPYAVMAFFLVLAALLSGAIALDRPIAFKEQSTLAGLFAGVGFIRRNPAILGSISLDLFAVLLGGATPAVGALLMGLALTRFPIDRRVGMRIFQAVIIFGVATVVFALSSLIWLSLLALAVLGAADMVSMVIRIARGAIVHSRRDAWPRWCGELFIRQCLIPARRVRERHHGGVAGRGTCGCTWGIGTIVVALLWMKFFPALSRVERLE
jgi:MFS family permease